MDRSVFLYSDALLNYRFNAEHPFNQQRLKLTLDLLQSIHAIKDAQMIAPRIATEEELLLIHDPGYVRAVKLAGNGELPQEQAEGYGLGTEDTPIFPQMHEASSLLVGGALTAADYVMQGKAEHALHLGGGFIMALEGRHLGFVFIMTAQWQLNIYEKSTMPVSFILIRMLIMAMVYNGRFMMIQMYVHYQSMKLVDTYFPEQGILMKEVIVMDMAIRLIYL